MLRSHTRPSAGNGPPLTHRGVSLAELLVVIVVMGVAGGALSRVAVLQQRQYRGLSDAIEARGQLRQATELLTSELRGVSAMGGDIYEGEMHAVSIAFRSTVGSYMLCRPPAAGAGEIEITHLEAIEGEDAPPESPGVGDSLWIYDAGPAVGGSDDAWRRHIVTASVTLGTSCMAASDSTGRADQLPATAPAYRLSLQPTPASPLDAHTPVRVFRRVRYALYQSSDGAWYLGFSDCRPIVRAPPCASIQPVSGPYDRYASPGSSRSSGLTLSYLDANGRPTSDERAVSRIVVTVRAPAPNGDGASIDATVALRNQPR